MSKYNVRIEHKQDTYENWSRANNFRPLNGELIIYKPDPDNTEQTYGIKIGNEQRDLVNDLPFILDKDLIQEIAEKVITEWAALAPEELNTLEELAAALQNNPEIISVILEQLDSKADKSEVGDKNVQSNWNEISSNSDAYIQNKPNIKNGDGANSILIGEGDANGKYSIAGGTNDKDLIGDLAGDLSSIIGNVEIAKADGDMSMSFGAGTITRTAGTLAVGANAKAGIKGFYFTKVSGNTLTLSTKQPTILSSSAKWDSSAQAQLDNWKSGDTITVVNDANYVMCSKITSISNTASAASITVDALPFTSKATVVLPILNDFSVINHDKPDAGVIGLGLGSVSLGLKNEAHGLFSLAEGRENLAAGNYAHAEGLMTKAGHTAHSEGYKTNAKGNFSHAENSNTTSSGENSHAEGLHTESGGTNSHAEGNGAKAMGLNSHAEGCNTEVTGGSSHVEGLNVQVYGNDSHGEGYQNTIEATASHAHVEGARNVVKANSAHAEGDSTIASSFAQHVQGKYNVEDSASKYAHIVGGGTSDSDRKNIHTLDWKGNAYFAGVITDKNGEFSLDTLFPDYMGNIEDVTNKESFKLRTAQDVIYVNSLYKNSLPCLTTWILFEGGSGDPIEHQPEVSDLPEFEYMFKVDFLSTDEEIYTGYQNYKTTISEASKIVIATPVAQTERTTLNRAGIKDVASYTFDEKLLEVFPPYEFEEHVFAEKEPGNYETITFPVVGKDIKVRIYCGEDKPTAFYNVSTPEYEEQTRDYNQNTGRDYIVLPDDFTYDTRWEPGVSYYNNAGDIIKIVYILPKPQGKHETLNIENIEKLVNDSADKLREEFSNLPSGGETVQSDWNVTDSSSNAYIKNKPAIKSGTGVNSIIEGSGCQATAKDAHAEGVNCIASGGHSHAEGSNTQAKGYDSHAEGERTIATSNVQHVQGRYNETLGGDYYHIVGNGTSDTNRSNAHWLKKNGDAWFAGTVSDKNGELASFNALFPEQEAWVDITDEAVGEYYEIQTDNTKLQLYTEQVPEYMWILSADHGHEPTVFFKAGATSPYILPDDLEIDSDLWQAGCCFYTPTADKIYANLFVEQADKTAVSPTVLAETLEQERIKITKDVIDSVVDIKVDLPIEKGEPDNSIIFGEGKVLSEMSIAGGQDEDGSIANAGCKGFFYKYCDGNTIYLSIYQYGDNGWNDEAQALLNQWVDKKINIVGSHKHTMCSTVLSISEAAITVDKLPFGEQIPFDNDNDNKYKAVDWSTLANPDWDDGAIYCPELPEAGLITFGRGARSIGANTQAIGTYSVAEGKQTLAANDFGHAEGRWTKAGYASHAEGYSTSAIGQGAHSEGHNTDASAHSSHAEGRGSAASNSASHAEGVGTKAQGVGSHSEGNATTASGGDSHAEGYLSQATASHSHAEGKNTQATGNSAHSEGEGSVASGVGSHAEGNNTKATGNYSHAEGINTINAEGAVGTGSHVEGANGAAKGNYSHVEGLTCKTSAGASGAHAEGEATEANAKYSHAEGWHNTINEQCGHVQGKYNDLSKTTGYAHIVGGGTSESDRKNIHTLDWNGNAWYAGKVEATAAKINGTEFSSAFQFKLTYDDGTTKEIKVLGVEV